MELSVKPKDNLGAEVTVAARNEIRKAREQEIIVRAWKQRAGEGTGLIEELIKEGLTAREQKQAQSVQKG